MQCDCVAGASRPQHNY